MPAIASAIVRRPASVPRSARLQLLAMVTARAELMAPVLARLRSLGRGVRIALKAGPTLTSNGANIAMFVHQDFSVPTVQFAVTQRILFSVAMDMGSVTNKVFVIATLRGLGRTAHLAAMTIMAKIVPFIAVVQQIAAGLGFVTSVGCACVALDFEASTAPSVLCLGEHFPIVGLPRQNKLLVLPPIAVRDLI